MAVGKQAAMLSDAHTVKRRMAFAEKAAIKHNGHGISREVRTLTAGECARVLRPAEQRRRPAADVDYVTRHLTMYTVYTVRIV